MIAAIDEETDGWKIDPDDHTSENKSALTRLKLSNSEAIQVRRVARWLREMERARLQKLS